MIAEMRVELEKEKAEARSRPKSYAVVPYRGPNETYRRPIYIECRAGEVILQPEGIKFTKADFLSPMGPGNPLAKALRAAAEYHSSHDRQSIDTKTGDDQQEAYPLILVRPDGAELYGGVRNAIRSWGSRFGYEMIEQDWELSFPPPNPELAALEQRAASESRAMRAHVARSRPRHAARPRHIEGAVRFSATSSSGGFRREGGGQQHDWVDHGFGAESFSAKQAKATQFGTSGDARVRKSDPARNDMDKPENLGDEQRDDTHPSNDKPKQIGPAGSPSGNSTEGTDAAGSQTGATGGTAVQALSSKRGAGWARAKSRSGTVPINRPIHIVCRADRFVILATGRFANFDVKDLATYRAASKNVVRLHGETVKAIDRLVAAIHDHTNSWGIAGKNLYWQPSLILNVAPDGEGRASDLEVLLKDGGLEVTRAQGGQR